MYQVTWEFRPRPGRAAEFIEAYGPEGAWARLFARAPGYLGSELQVPDSPDGWYRTVDHWETAGARAWFLEEFAAEYAALDRACAALTCEERPQDDAHSESD